MKTFTRTLNRCKNYRYSYRLGNSGNVMCEEGVKQFLRNFKVKANAEVKSIKVTISEKATPGSTPIYIRNNDIPFSCSNHIRFGTSTQTRGRLRFCVKPMRKALDINNNLQKFYISFNITK